MTWELKELMAMCLLPTQKHVEKGSSQKASSTVWKVGSRTVTCGRMWVQGQLGLTSNSPIWVTFWDLVSNTITTTETDKNNKNKSPKPKFVSKSPPAVVWLVCVPGFPCKQSQWMDRPTNGTLIKIHCRASRLAELFVVGVLRASLSLHTETWEL